MKVLMLGRTELLSAGGGDRIQVENTAGELRKLGVEVDIKTDLEFEPLGYDLIHIFQLDWITECYFYAKKAQEAGKPIILSPIHHNLWEVKRFDDKYTFDYRRLAAVLFRNQFARDTLKNVYRSILKPKKIKYTLLSVLKGLKNMHIEVLESTKMVLVQTMQEAKDLKETYGVDIKWRIVLNGVGENFTKPGKFKNNLGFENYLICVGRIEPRKNQLNIIQAVKTLREETGADLKLVLIGARNKINHFEYTLRFESELKNNPWITHIDSVPYREMPNYYHFAKVGISASWFETTGLTSLEALFMGANAVASGENAKEYLGKYASYCEPDDVVSIKDAIKIELNNKRPRLPEDVRSKYTWEKAAKDTLDVYNEVLENEDPISTVEDTDVIVSEEELTGEN